MSHSICLVQWSVRMITPPPPATAMQECKVFHLKSAQLGLTPDLATADMINQIREQMLNDPIQAVFHKAVLSGWPSERKKLLEEIKPTGSSEMKAQCMMKSFTSLVELSYLPPCDLKCYTRYTVRTKLLFLALVR